MSGNKPPPERFEPPEGNSLTEADFDEELAQSYVGRTIIVGLTYLDHHGNFLEQRQVHGEIISAHRDGIRITLAGNYAGENWSLPPTLENIQGAPAGEYRFRETGEVVVDPDLMATWTITTAARH